MRDVIKAMKALGAFAACIVALSAVRALAVGPTPSSPSPAPPVAAACTSDPLQVGLTTAYSASVGAEGGYAVTDVTITDTAPIPDLAACTGQTYRVTLQGASGASLGEVTGMVPAGTTSFSPAAGFVPPVDASLVTGVAVVIGG
jgi:hypothetical protein